MGGGYRRQGGISSGDCTLFVHFIFDLFRITYYTTNMGKREQTKLIKTYTTYRTTKKKKDVLGIFRTLMPEIIFRTTKLEGEPVTREMVSSLFK